MDLRQQDIKQREEEIKQLESCKLCLQFYGIFDDDDDDDYDGDEEEEKEKRRRRGRRRNCRRMTPGLQTLEEEPESSDDQFSRQIELGKMVVHKTDPKKDMESQPLVSESLEEQERFLDVNDTEAIHVKLNILTKYLRD
ncbi:hypothetical protein DPMN_107891 [Dreissena polymorpha]|uniref:Uncharacterized protein n=1 Tax=Dreissena polymorpha TaxID=45954 RepID=A0A9D4K7Q7_DREPO|nr:hypothetical protein DPMN_107891 [Dreissena polymorpha]